MEISVRAPSLLYRNHGVRLLDVGDTPGEEFLLFCRATHYWVALNPLGAAVMRALEAPATEAAVLTELRGQGFDDETKARSLLEHLLKDRFLLPHPPAAEAAPATGTLQTDRPQDYALTDLIVSLSDRCNLACSYCFNAPEREIRIAERKTGRLSRERIGEMAREYAAMGGAAILITGGEPTLNPDFLDICRDAKAAGLAVKVITNGTRLDRLDPQQLAEAVDLLAVSLDSVDDATNAALWKTSRYKVRDTLAALQRVGAIRRADGSQVTISIKPTLTRRNLAALPDLVRGVTSALVDCTYMFDLSVYEKIGDAATDADLAVSPREVEASLREAYVGAAGESASDLLKAEAEAFARFRGAPDAGVSAPRNASCTPSLFVTNDGSIYPCQALELPEFQLGNVAAGDSLQAAFAAAPFSELRKTMSRDDIEGCSSCDLRYACMSHCHGAAFKKTGRTTAQLSDGVSCKRKLARALWADVRITRVRRRTAVSA